MKAVALALLIASASGPFAASQPMKAPLCRTVIDQNKVLLISPAFEFELDTANGLRSVAWTNKLTKTRLALHGGKEIEFDLDAAERRVPITGWWVAPTNSGPCEPNDEMGYKDTAYAVDHSEAGFGGYAIPIPDGWPDSPVNCNYLWARTHVFLPSDLTSKDLTLVLGGFGLFDFRRMRVFVNGHELKTRYVSERWHQPGRWRFGLTDEARKWLRFGADNSIALQTSGFFGRTAELDAVDPRRSRELGHMLGWPPQFEQYIIVGRDVSTPKLVPTSTAIFCEGDHAKAEITLRSYQPRFEVALTYRWNAREPVLHKTVEIVNAGKTPKPLRNVRLADYATDASTTDGEQGFPVYLDRQFFAGLAHPSGWAIGDKGRLILRQYPGRSLPPGAKFESMEAVLGVAKLGQAREGFLAHVRSRMRRTVRHHDHAYAIFESFGSWPSGDYWGGTEADMFDLIGKISEGQNDTGSRFDIFAIELWMDRRGDGERPDLKRFPHRFARIGERLAPLGTRLGLWTDSSWTPWTFTGNPVVHPCLNYDEGYGPGGRPAVCRATDPFKTMFTDAQIGLAKESGVRLFKFDNLTANCYNPHHAHLPGIYSTEAFQNAVIETFHAIDRAAPDALIMLYWGHRSPWWLLHADTLFESGLTMEAASPAETPSLYARDSVTVGLDQGQAWCADVPPLGKDSLGIWLSDWGWNSSIGKERWQEGVIMDICRGSMLAQVWTDRGWLSPPERRQFADFVGLLRAYPKCFGNPTPMGGSPWRHEPYGYRCSDGQRTFLALNNCTWSDVSMALPVEPASEVYRWYPSPAFLGSEVREVRLRPFEVALIEAAPAGSKPSLGRSFPASTDVAAEPSVEIPLEVMAGTTGDALKVPAEGAATRVFVVAGQWPASKSGGLAAVTFEMRRGAVAAPHGDIGRLFAVRGWLDGKEVEAKPILGMWTYASPWQGWRVALPPSDRVRSLRLSITAAIDPALATTCKGHFVPR